MKTAVEPKLTYRLTGTVLEYLLNGESIYVTPVNDSHPRILFARLSWRDVGHHTAIRIFQEATEAPPCEACIECAKLAWSDMTTPGFFHRWCEVHRQ